MSDRIVLMDKGLIAEQDVPDYVSWVSANEWTRAFLARSNKWESSSSGDGSDNPSA